MAAIAWALHGWTGHRPLRYHACSLTPCLCGLQAKSGMGKTAVFVLSTMHLLDPTDDHVQVSFTSTYIQAAV